MNYLSMKKGLLSVKGRVFSVKTANLSVKGANLSVNIETQFEKTQCETRNIQRRALWFEKRCALRVEQDATDTVPQKYVCSTPLQFHHPTPQMDSTGEYNFTSRRKPTVARRAGLTAPLVKPKPWRQRHLNVRSHHTTQ